MTKKKGNVWPLDMVYLLHRVESGLSDGNSFVFIVLDKFRDREKFPLGDYTRKMRKMGSSFAVIPMEDLIEDRYLSDALLGLVEEAVRRGCQIFVFYRIDKRMMLTSRVRLSITEGWGNYAIINEFRRDKIYIESTTATVIPPELYSLFNRFDLAKLCMAGTIKSEGEFYRIVAKINSDPSFVYKVRQHKFI